MGKGVVPTSAFHLPFLRLWSNIKGALSTLLYENRTASFARTPPSNARSEELVSLIIYETIYFNDALERNTSLGAAHYQQAEEAPGLIQTLQQRIKHGNKGCKAAGR